MVSEGSRKLTAKVPPVVLHDRLKSFPPSRCRIRT